MESDRWPLIYAAIQQHLQKIYNGKKAALKERHWIPDSDGTYDLERIRLSRPSHISEVNWDAQIGFWNDPKNRGDADYIGGDAEATGSRLQHRDGHGTVIPPSPPCTYSSDFVKLKKREKVLTRQVNMFMKLFRSDDKFSQMLTQLESQPEIGGGSGSGGRGDDEQGDDEDDGEDGQDEDDS
ncbi:hypothetical protein Tco_1178377 [Tanacetum coccineum]